MIDIYVINLLNRPDRKEKMIEMYQVFKRINLIFIEAVYDKIGSIGCFRSHKKSIKYAKDNNMDYIIVLEDDSLPCDNFEDRMMNIIDYLDNNDFEIFLGMVNKCSEKKITNVIKNNKENLIEIKSANSAHLIIYNKKVYDFFLSENEEIRAVDRCWNNKIKAIVTLPFLVYPTDDFSNIEQKQTNYLPHIKKTEDNLITTMNNLNKKYYEKISN